jgi:hypothetical protein
MTKNNEFKKTLGFGFGIQSHLEAMKLLTNSPLLLKWYGSMLFLSLLATIFVLIVLSVSGLWFFWEGLSLAFLGESWLPYESWIKGLFSVFWIFIVLFLGGFLGAQLAGLFVQLFFKEDKLFTALSHAIGDSIARDSVMDQGLKRHFIFKEYKSVFLSLVVSIFCWPLLLVPFLFPIGVLLFSYVVGRESYDTSERMCFERKFLMSSNQTLPDKLSVDFKENNQSQILQRVRISGGLYIALGLPSVLFGLIPVLGWLGWPFLRISALSACLARKSAVNSNAMS